MSQSAQDRYWIPSGKIQPRASLFTLPSLSHSCHKHTLCMKEVKGKVAQSCPTLCDPMDCTVRGILQARILEWGKKKNTGVGNLFPSPGDLPNPGIKPRSPALQVDSLPAELSGKPKLCITFLKGIKRDFPGGPLLKALCSQYRGPGIKPWSWN